jgi:hypothetical protein
VRERALGTSLRGASHPTDGVEHVPRAELLEMGAALRPGSWFARTLGRTTFVEVPDRDLPDRADAAYDKNLNEVDVPRSLLASLRRDHARIEHPRSLDDEGASAARHRLSMGLALLAHEATHAHQWSGPYTSPWAPLQTTWGSPADRIEWRADADGDGTTTPREYVTTFEVPAYRAQERTESAFGATPEHGWLTLDAFGHPKSDARAATDILHAFGRTYGDVDPGAPPGRKFPGRKFPGRKFPGRKFPGGLE